jgi:hypothetical protein
MHKGRRLIVVSSDFMGRFDDSADGESAVQALVSAARVWQAAQKPLSPKPNEFPLR